MRRAGDNGDVELRETRLELARIQVLQTTVSHVFLLIHDARLRARDIGGRQARREDEPGSVRANRVHQIG